MDKPTEEQIKEFWEWCRARCIKCSHLISNTIKADMCYCHTFELDLDLNTLFKYAVPNLQDRGNQVELLGYEHKGYMATVYKDCFSPRGSDGYDPYLEPISQVKDDDPALALFWAIWQVKPPKEKTISPQKAREECLGRLLDSHPQQKEKPPSSPVGYV